MTPERKSELAALCRAHVEREIARSRDPSPGPWAARRDGSVVDASGEVVAIVMRHADLGRLAAAPELFAALRELAEDADSLCDFVGEGAAHMVGAREAHARARRNIETALDLLRRITPAAPLSERRT